MANIENLLFLVRHQNLPEYFLLNTLMSESSEEYFHKNWGTCGSGKE